MRILIVDDSETICRLLENYLAGQCGHEVMTCDNGETALGILRRERFDMVLSDIVMPRMDGNALLRAIKGDEALADMVVVLITGHGNIKNAVDAIRNGAHDYLTKPVDLDELGMVMRKIERFLVLREQKEQLSKKVNEQQEETDAMKNELDELRKAYAREIGSEEIGVFSDSLREVFWKAKRLHDNRNIPVLIEGETGTGKEVVARYIHFGDGSVTTPFIGVNCAAISSTLFESELFGYEAGAFTGGHPKGQKGKFDMANGGSIFLDEITEMQHEHQAKLLRVIQEREYYRVGGLTKYATDARIICATNQNVIDQVQDGTFRRDLYYRLNVGHITIPPLRERRKEIMPMAVMFLQKYAAEQKSRFTRISREAANLLRGHDWPGNVRELKSAIQRITLLWDDEEVGPEHIDFILQGGPGPERRQDSQEQTSVSGHDLPRGGMDLNDHILDIVQRALEMNNGNKTETALFLGISRHVLYTYLKHLEEREVVAV